MTQIRESASTSPGAASTSRRPVHMASPARRMSKLRGQAPESCCQHTGAHKRGTQGGSERANEGTQSTHRGTHAQHTQGGTQKQHTEGAAHRGGSTQRGQHPPLGLSRTTRSSTSPCCSRRFW